MDVNKVDREVLANIARSTRIYDHEREQVAQTDRKYKDKQILTFDTQTIRKEKRATLLRSEFVRLMELKQQFYRELDEILASSSLLAEEQEKEKEQEAADQERMKVVSPDSGEFSELLHRAKMRAMENVRYIYAKPRCMEVLERECPQLMNRETRSFRDTLTKSLLLNEDPDPTVFMIQLEVLEMIERGELSQEEASMKMGKMAFERDRLIELVGRQLRNDDREVNDAEVKKLFYKSNQELKSMLKPGKEYHQQFRQKKEEEEEEEKEERERGSDNTLTYAQFKAGLNESKAVAETPVSSSKTRRSRRKTGRR